MNYTSEQLKDVVVNLHLQIEVAKMNGLTPSEAVNQSKDVVAVFDELSKSMCDLSETEKKSLLVLLNQQVLEITNAFDFVLVAINQDVYGYATELKLDIEYAKEFISTSREFLKNLIADFEKTLMGDKESEVNTEEVPVLLS